jgi:hypothetical protein
MRCAEDEMGKNSVTPWNAPITNADVCPNRTAPIASTAINTAIT